MPVSGKAGWVAIGRVDWRFDEREALLLLDYRMNMPEPDSGLDWGLAGILCSLVLEWKKTVARVLEVEVGSSADKVDSAQKYIHQWWTLLPEFVMVVAGCRRDHSWWCLHKAGSALDQAS